MIKTRRWRRRN